MVDQAKKLLNQEIDNNKPLILLNHMRFDPSVLNYFPGDNTLKISIIRDPATMFPSVFSHYKKECHAFIAARTLENFLKDPDFFTEKYFKIDQTFSHNNMLYDLGFSKCLKKGYLREEVCKIGDLIDELEKRYDLVLIMEYFDEAILLLKQYLDFLSFEDLVYLKVHQRQIQKETDSTIIGEQSRSWNSLEFDIYRHFNKTFSKKIESIFGGIDSEKMLSEKAKLEFALIKFKQYYVTDDSSIAKLSSTGNKIIRYEVRSNLSDEQREYCEKTMRRPADWAKIIFDKQKSTGT